MASERYETPKEMCLDCSIFKPGNEVLLYRLVSPGRTQFDGLASAKWAGRWNRVGQPTIYTSLDLTTTIAEVLHHIEADEIPSDYVVMTIRLRIPQRLALPATVLSSKKRPVVSTAETMTTSDIYAAQMRIHESIQQAEIAFENPVREENPFALAVPSVRAAAWNVALYPEAPGFWNHVALLNEKQFVHPDNFAQ